MTTMYPTGGDPSQMPIDLAAVLADEELLGKLGDPVALREIAPGLQTELATALVAWQKAHYVGDDPDLLTLEEALTALDEAHRRHNRRVSGQLGGWIFTAVMIAAVLVAILVLAGCDGAQRQVTRQVTESLAAAPTVTTQLPGIPKYNDNHFGGGRWASADDGPAGTDCTVRGLVLYAETVASGQQPVDGDDRDKCAEDGKFTDVYTGQIVDPETADEEVDHVLARYDAWVLGAWRWDREQRWAFSNDQANLRATTGAVNGGEKGSKGPDEWRPADRAGWCAYASIYDATAMRWSLPVSAPRRGALDEMLATC